MKTNYFDEIIKRIGETNISRNVLSRIFEFNISIRKRILIESQLTNNEVSKTLMKVMQYEINQILSND